MNGMWLSINYDLLKRWKPILATAFSVILIYQAIIYLHPANTGWIKSPDFAIGNLLHFLFIDQMLIECITVTIVFQLIRFYGIFFKLSEVRLNIKDILIYEAKFILVLLVSFFLFAPFTLTTRFLYHYMPEPDWNLYLSDYFYSVELYINYLTPVILIGFIAINSNLIALYNQQLGETKADLKVAKKPKMKDRIWASDEWGELFLDVDKIFWIERENRKSLATTDKDKYRLKENITELEEKLNPDRFVRINRGTIVNLDFVQNYSFWENDKYILRMKESAKEFVMSRERLQKIKDKFLYTE